MMTKKIILLALFVLSFSLTGCSSAVPDHSEDYLQAQSMPPMKLPEGVSYNSNYENYYAIPTDKPIEDIQPVSLVPPGLYESEAQNKKEFDEWWKKNKPQSMFEWSEYFLKKGKYHG